MEYISSSFPLSSIFFFFSLYQALTQHYWSLTVEMYLFLSLHHFSSGGDLNSFVLLFTLIYLSFSPFRWPPSRDSFPPRFLFHSSVAANSAVFSLLFVLILTFFDRHLYCWFITSSHFSLSIFCFTGYLESFFFFFFFVVCTFPS